ncbi:MAG: hypothetical protein LBJ02_02360 [Bifidobacteriaceae bacterium]|nr:hypothetical protein [Bifidobacteriaceae bacterium]
MTAKVNKTHTWGKGSGTVTIQGYKEALLSEKTANGVWTNRVRLEIKQTKSEKNLQGFYGKFHVGTSVFKLLPFFGAGTLPVTQSVGTEEKSATTAKSLDTTLSATLKIGTSQRGSWTRTAQLCANTKLRPDTCSSAYTW